MTVHQPGARRDASLASAGFLCARERPSLPPRSPRPTEAAEEKKIKEAQGWEDGTPPPHRDFKERGVVR